MKTFMTLLVFAATFSAHAAVYQSSNATCPHRQAGGLTNIGDTNPKPTLKVQRKDTPATNTASTASSSWSRR